MKSRLAFAVALGALAVPLGLVLAPDASSTSGGLDARGGHHCWTRCVPQGLYTGQYHCHRGPCGKADIRLHRSHGH